MRTAWNFRRCVDVSGSGEKDNEAYGVFGRVGSDGSGEQLFGVEQRCVWHGATMAMNEWIIVK